MQIFLGILAVLALLIGVFTIGLAKTVIGEIEGLLFFVMTAVLLSGAAIVDTIFLSRKKADEVQQRHFERLSEFLNKKIK